MSDMQWLIVYWFLTGILGGALLSPWINRRNKYKATAGDRVFYDHLMGLQKD